MFKAIIFDIDGVLLDSFEANWKFYQDLMVKNGYRAPTRKEILAIINLPMMDGIKILTGLTDEAEIKRIWKMGRDRVVPYPVGLVSIPEGLEEVIKNLSRKYQLAIVTSRVKNSVYSISYLAKLKKYFKVAVAYEDTAEHKPSPGPLLLAARKLNLKPGECVYVGDMASDLTAARAAGMKAVMYSKNKFNRADAQTKIFKKLPEVILSLE